MVRCSKCGREAWVVLVRRHSTKGLDRQTYTYRRYRHYVGTRKSITLKALEKILMAMWNKSPLFDVDLIMSKARTQTGERTVDHYVRA